MDIQSLFDKELLDGVRKDVEYEFRMIVKTLGEQIATRNRFSKSTYEEPNYFFSTKFYNKAQEFGLNETDAIEVYNTGQAINEETIVREYNGYEVGIEYTLELYSGKPLITSVWKREL